MSAAPAPADPRIDLYLDGLLTGDELSAFERDLAASPELRAQIEAQSRIDAGIRELFAYDPSRAVLPESVAPGASQAGRNPAPVARIGPETTPELVAHPPAGPRLHSGRDGRAVGATMHRRLRVYAVAAVVLLSLAASWVAYINITTPRFDNLLSPDAVYAMVEKPEFVCRDDAEFAAAIDKRLGQPLVLAASPGVTALGWAYGDDYSGKIVGPRTMVLINRVDEVKVLVFMDRLRDDRPLSVRADGGLNLFRREAGALVLYELTPLEKPRVIEHLVPPGQ